MDKKQYTDTKGLTTPALTRCGELCRMYHFQTHWQMNKCSALNILKLELNYSTDEARAIRISRLYQEYQSELEVPTKYEVNGKTYYIDRDTDNIIKFNSAHEVAKMKGDNLFRAKNEAGEYELVTLTVGDFESILLNPPCCNNPRTTASSKHGTR